MGKLNIMSSPNTAARLNILGVPFLLVYDNGQLRESLPAVADIGALRAKMAAYM